MITFFSIVTSLCYLSAAFIQTLQVLGRVSVNKKSIVILLGILAICGHAWLLYHWIDIGSGQNLSIWNMFSQIAWLVSSLVLLLSYYQPILSLGIVVFPITALSVVLAWLIPGNNIVAIGENPLKLLHILFALLAFSVLAIATSQALLLTIHDWILKRHQRLPLTSNVLRSLPPLETVERLLFRMVGFGFILLSCVVVTSLISFPRLSLSAQNTEHTLLPIAAWLVFATLLSGRIFFGWRGQIAIYGTMGGMMLLFLSYFGSGLLLHLA